MNSFWEFLKVKIFHVFFNVVGIILHDFFMNLMKSSFRFAWPKFGVFFWCILNFASFKISL